MQLKKSYLKKITSYHLSFNLKLFISLFNKTIITFHGICLIHPLSRINIHVIPGEMKGKEKDRPLAAFSLI